MRVDNPGIFMWPPLLYALAFFIGVLLQALIPVQLPLRWLGLLLIILAVAIIVPASMAFRRAGTNIEPWKPATALVTSGPYKLTRNPLYLALTLGYTGLSLALQLTWPLALLIPLLFLMRYGVIGREERYLEAKFGTEYIAYKRRVRRWI